jgi:hypothetical protein
MAKRTARSRKTKRVQSPTLAPSVAIAVFQAAAEAVGSDIIQASAEMGGPAEVPRDVLYDYVGECRHEQAEAVHDFIMNHPGSMRQLEEDLDGMGVPRSWS